MSDKVISIQQLSFPWETNDPFLFCVHHEDAFPKGNEKMGPDNLEGRNLGNDFTIKDGWRMYHGREVPGFPAHPHRGFETVTIVRTGFVDHADSLGARGRFGQGDVQWMTAGKGVQHSEMFPLLQTDKDNPFELFQIWLNLPSGKKYVEPHYKMLWHEDIPFVDIKDDKGKKTTVRLVAGSIEGKKAPAPAPDSWAADPTNDVAIWTIKMEANAEWEIPASENDVNRRIYFFKGDTVEVEGENLPFYHLAELKADSTCNIKNGDKDAELLFLQGKPINEPVAQYGPFVMNNQQEIQETMMAYQKDQFGGWPWPKGDYVIERNRGRFAQYADGKVEERDK